MLVWVYNRVTLRRLLKMLVWVYNRVTLRRLHDRRRRAIAPDHMAGGGACCCNTHVVATWEKRDRFSFGGKKILKKSTACRNSQHFFFFKYVIFFISLLVGLLKEYRSWIDIFTDFHVITVNLLVLVIHILSASSALFGTFLLRIHVPFFQISYYSIAIWVLCLFLSLVSSLLFPCARYCVGYTPRAWDPRSL